MDSSSIVVIDPGDRTQNDPTGPQMYISNLKIIWVRKMVVPRPITGLESYEARGS